MTRFGARYIDQKKREIDRVIESEFATLFEEVPGRVEGGRPLVVTDEMREEEEPAMM